MPEVLAAGKHRVRRAFHRAATRYDAAARLQRQVCERLATYLAAPESEVRRVLDAGSGTGFAVPLLRARYPQAQLVELDLAHAMLRVSRDKHGAGAAVCADLERLPLADACVDLVWSSLALQWAPALAPALAELQRVLRPGGWLIFSTLGPQTLRELRQAFAAVDGAAHVNRFAAAGQIRSALTEAGFHAEHLESECHTLRYATLKEVLRGLKDIGAQTVTHGRSAGLMGKGKWRRLEQIYEQLRVDGTLPATYEVFYAVAHAVPVNHHPEQ